MNYEFKGTPGPWHMNISHLDVISENGLDGHFHSMSGNILCGSQALASILGIKDTIYDCGWVAYEEAEPNAHLIAAAPCLLQAAIRLISLSENDGGHLKSGNGSHYLNDLKLAIHKALNIQ